jgi:hypothetical protein
MDPIQPIGPRPPWIAELAAEQTRNLSRENRKQSGGDGKRGPRREPPREPGESDEDKPDGRHIDVRA